MHTAQFCHETSDLYTLCLMVQQSKGNVAHLIHLKCSPAFFYPTKCCPWVATSARSHRTMLRLTLYLKHLRKRNVMTSLVYTIVGNTRKVLTKHGISVVLAHNRCVVFSEERHQMKESVFGKAMI